MTDGSTTISHHQGDVEITMVGSATERKLRIFSIAGDCMLERTAQELKPYNRVRRRHGMAVGSGWFWLGWFVSLMGSVG
eukprot:Skav201152  [mRNA]  locus=scaffold2068:248648:248884:+ [translate_table: standard]